jgi:hypothetical protein
MTVKDHERFRRQLEKQLRADAALLYAAYCAKLRAYETLHRLPGELGDLDPSLLLPTDLPLSLPAPAPAAAVPAPAPARPPRKGANELYDAVQAVLAQLPEVFGRRDVCAALGYEPHRASLYKVFRHLARGGWIAFAERGGGQLSNLYRNLSASVPPASDGSE